jgi:large subunit ribosomal protein L15
MELNNISPPKGSNRLSRRVGRGMGSGFGKTCGRGSKGQKSRSGGYHKVGFEGGQMPLQRGLPKRGFTSFSKQISSSLFESIGIKQILLLNEENVDLNLLKEKGVVSNKCKKIKLFLSCAVDKKINIKGILVTKGLRAAVEASGGSVE